MLDGACRAPGILRDLEGLTVFAEFGQREGEPASRLQRHEAGARVALVHAVAAGQRDVAPEVVNGGVILADVVMRLTEVEVGEDDEGRIGEPGGDLGGAIAEVDGAPRLPGRGAVMRQMPDR